MTTHTGRRPLLFPLVTYLRIQSPRTRSRSGRRLPVLPVQVIGLLILHQYFRTLPILSYSTAISRSQAVIPPLHSVTIFMFLCTWRSWVTIFMYVCTWRSLSYMFSPTLTDFHYLSPTSCPVGVQGVLVHSVCNGLMSFFSVAKSYRDVHHRGPFDTAQFPGRPSRPHQLKP